MSKVQALVRRPLPPPSRDGEFARLVRPDGMVHRTVFTDPAIFEREMTQVFGGTWVFLLHVSEIPKPNDFKCVTIGRRPVIVTRGADGEIRALMNRCTHRGTTVCLEAQGNAKRFQCAYHGWSFSNTGELLTVTFAEGYGPGFDKAAHNLGRFPRVESYGGYLFGSLNAEVEPLNDWLGPAKTLIDWSLTAFTTPGARVVRSSSMVFNANWKLQNDNNGDMYHVPFTHRSIAQMTADRHGSGKALDHFRGDNNPMVVKYLGHGHKLIDQRPSIPSPWERARPVPGREEYAGNLVDNLGLEQAQSYLNMTGRAGINLILYPNMIISGAGSFNVYEPIAVDKTVVHSYGVVLDDAPMAVNALKSRFLEDFAGFGYRDDNEIFERIQHSLTTIPEMEWVDFSKGLGTDRESVGDDGSITGAVSDETGIRGAYQHWVELMERTVHPCVLT
ncbi:MAG: Rieske (2Fe-2S) protein [Pseudomonadota bacterium]|jgi:phenylpropionate dioxygenase-like ring-hydroxylating dioxygenase large terminal subunit